MKALFPLVLIISLLGSRAHAQMTVDTSHGRVVVTNRVPGAVKTLSIYSSFVPPNGKHHQVVYLPNDVDYTLESSLPMLSFSTESAIFKSMLDAAMKSKQFNFYKLSFNVLPYKDLLAKLADIYSNSAEWNDYLKKADLHHVYKLDDGNEVTEVGYDANKAAAVIAKSDFLAGLNAIFNPLGYQVGGVTFADDHQVILSPDQLRITGKQESLFVPVPIEFFTVTRIKK